MEHKIDIIEWLTDVISVSQSAQRRFLNLKIEKLYDDPSGCERFDPVRYIEDSSKSKPIGHMMRQPITCRRKFNFQSKKISSYGDFVMIRILDKSN